MLPYLASGSWNMSKVTLEGSIHTHNGPWNSRVSAHLTDEFSAIMNYMKQINNTGACSFKQILVHDEERNTSGADEAKAIYICDAVKPFRFYADTTSHKYPYVAISEQTKNLNGLKPFLTN